MKLNIEKSTVSKDEVLSYKEEIEKCHKMLHEGTGEGSSFLGWVNLKNDDKEIERIKNAAKRINENSDILIVIGIGGSYLGARAVIEALSNPFQNKKVIFAGNNVSPDYLNDLLDYIKDKDISLNVISKSGTTIEPAISFKVLREFLEEKYGEEEARKRCYNR